MKKALITGITGQDGSYLTEFLLKKNYEVHGLIRRSSTFNTDRIDHVYEDPHNKNTNLKLHYGDLSDPGIITELIYDIHPTEIYNLGAQSHVRVSFDIPEYTSNITGLGTTRILESIRRLKINTKLYQASSSELFGCALAPQNENTSFKPMSPYAISKLYSYWMVKNYREAYNIFACNGILFNHESPRRDVRFVTRKITNTICRILNPEDKTDTLYLGNLDASRDWGFAPDYVQMMWLMLQQNIPNDFVVGTGESHTVREFIEECLNYIGIKINWKGEGLDEIGIIKEVNSDILPDHIKKGYMLIRIDPEYFRPTEVNYLKANISKAKKMLNWKPKVKFKELIHIMMDYDLKLQNLEYPGLGDKFIENSELNWFNNNI